jgi:hypothetical protein
VQCDGHVSHEADGSREQAELFILFFNLCFSIICPGETSKNLVLIAFGGGLCRREGGVHVPQKADQ